ncbi:MAG: hypothetical protein K8F36_06505 [Melioribacteraceae bacterium]|nr:hypothetical protein [Melioribacteraceae bacterium]
MKLVKYFSALLFLNTLIFPQFLYNEKDTVNGDHYNYLDMNNVFLWTSNNGLVGFDPIEELNQFKWYNELNEEAVILFGGGLQWSCNIDGEIRTNGAYYNNYGLQAGSIISSDNDPLVKLNRYRVYKISNNWEKFIPGKKKERFKKDIEEWYC